MSKTRLYIGAMLYWCRYFAHWCVKHRKKVIKGIAKCAILLLFFAEMIFLCGMVG